MARALYSLGSSLFILWHSPYVELFFWVVVCGTFFRFYFGFERYL